MNRIDSVFEACKEAGRTALIPFITAGDPDLKTTERLMGTLVENGADIIELGVPFSDPMADGPTIQEASARALESGVKLADILQLVARLRADGMQTPVVLFSYFNMIFHYGVEQLAIDSKAAGIDAWLTVDLPFEEADEVVPVLEGHGLHWIALIAPTTPEERLRRIVSRAGGFIYYITVTGVTGARTELPADLKAHLDMIHRASDLPVAAGFGISNPDMVRTVGEAAEGVIVGSKIIRTLQEGATPEEGVAAVGRLVKALSAAC